MRTSEQIDKIAPALIAVQKELNPVVRDAVNPHFKSHYVTLDSITEYVRPILAEKGLAVIQGGGDLTNGGMMIETTLLHDSGQWISQSFEIPVEKGTPQAAGSTITYGRRYGLAAILALTSEEDADANSAMPKRANSGGGAEASAQRGDGNRGGSPSPSATRSNGSGYLMPFGKSKGKPLASLDDKDLSGALEWAKEKGKFEEFQVAATKELRSRTDLRGADEMPAALDDREDDLPF